MTLTLGEIIKARREQLGLSRRQLAEKANMSHTEVNRIENGTRRNPSVNSVAKLSCALGLDTHKVLDAANAAEDEKKERIQSRDLRKFQKALEWLEEAETLYEESKCEHGHCALKDDDKYYFSFSLSPTHSAKYIYVYEDEEGFQLIRELIRKKIDKHAENVKTMWREICMKDAGEIPIEDMWLWFRDEPRRQLLRNGGELTDASV